MILLIQLAAALLLTPLTQYHHHHLQPFAQASADKENEVKLILEHIEKETLKFRDEIERAYGERCNMETISQCSKSNFNSCSSVFPNQQCMKADELVIKACGGGGGGNCNALWDKTTSSVSIPSAQLAHGLDPEIVETACYTLLAEDYMLTKYENDDIFWDAYKVQPSWTYFGAHNGLFRILPTLPQEKCGNYDPRLRPWFVAASSGPKDVVIVLDVSGSMRDHGRMDLAKEAAITVVDTLTISDRVAVIVFSDSAYQVPRGGTDSLIRATNENKKLLIDSIRRLSGRGATNFYAGFQKAFDALERTIEQEYTSGCNVAILFMTDGKRTTGPGTGEVLGLINDSTQRLATLYGRDTKIFTFSLGAQADHLVTKQIACSTNGMWTPVDDTDGDLVGAMASYYKLFALGLGDDTDFTAWVEPYEFFSAKKMGTTNSAPVFDRSVDPPLFLGVVATDMYLDALEQVLGEDAHSSTMLQRFIRLSTAQCPKIDLLECQLDALRFLSGGQEATCGRCSSTEYPGIIPAECPLKPDLPKNLWQNTDMERVKFEDRACCEIGSNVPSKKCPNKTGIIVGSTIASLFVICCCGWVFYKKCYKREVQTTNTPKKATLVSATLPDGSVLASSHVIPGVQELSSSEELSSFLSTNAFSLVCFSAKWCGPCRASKPQLEALAASYASDPNINVSCGIAYEHNLGGDIQNYRVRAFPTYALFQKSSEVGRVEGVNFEGIQSLVKQYCEAHDFGTGNSLGGGGNSGAVSAADERAQRLARFGGAAASPQPPPAEKKEAEQQTTATRKG